MIPQHCHRDGSFYYLLDHGASCRISHLLDSSIDVRIFLAEHLPIVIIRVVLDEFEQSVTDLVLALPDELFSQVKDGVGSGAGCFRGSAQCPLGFLAANVEAFAGARDALVFGVLCKALQGHIVLVLLLPGIHQGIVLKSADADHVALELQHVVHYGGKLVELLFLAGRCHFSQDGICLRVGHT